MSELLGMQSLEHTTTSTQQPGALGDEFDVILGSYDAGDDVYLNSNASRTRVRWLRNTGATALSAGMQVKRDTSGTMIHDVVIGTANAPACAIVNPFIVGTVAQGERFLGIIDGPAKVLSSAGITKGATLGAAASGKVATNAVDTVANLAHAFGVAAETASGGDELIDAIVHFSNIK